MREDHGVGRGAGGNGVISSRDGGNSGSGVEGGDRDGGGSSKFFSSYYLDLLFIRNFSNSLPDLVHDLFYQTLLGACYLLDLATAANDQCHTLWSSDFYTAQSRHTSA